MNHYIRMYVAMLKADLLTSFDGSSNGILNLLIAFTTSAVEISRLV